MGVVGSKSPLERRNTVLRRSQRKSIHGIKSKADKIIKDIRKFKGTKENTDYVELKARIEAAERDLKHHVKTLQPQIRNIYNEALKKTEGCHKLLEDKLKENQEKFQEKQPKEEEKKDEHLDEQEEEDDDVFVEEVNEETNDARNKRKTVELKMIQVEPIPASPQINKRFSAMKLGVPVMPGSIMESLHRREEEMGNNNARIEEKINEMRKEIEELEMEISQFVGKRNGRHYNKIKGQLDGYSHELRKISTNDDDILEQMKLCGQYITSCLSFLNEKATNEDDDDDEEDEDETFEENNIRERMRKNDVVVESNLSPRSIRTTYI